MNKNKNTFLNISALRNWNKNPRGIKKDKFEELKKRIQRHGQFKPLIITEDGEVLGGNMRLRAMKELGITDVWVSVVYPKTDAEKIEIALADNEEMGYYEEEALAELINEYKDDINLGDYSIHLGNPVSLDDLLAKYSPDEIIEDEAPELTDNAVSKLGEIYQLGRHYLMCGDATRQEDVEKLMDGKKADMVFTDPPYNLGYEYNEYNDNKTDEEYKQFCIDWFNLLKVYSDEKIILTTVKQNISMWCAIENPTEIAVWVHKNGISGGKVSNLSLWEPILFYGQFDRNSRASNLYEYELKRQDTGDEHTCPKQVSLIADIVKHYASELVLDVFGGSGTTLIACEQTNRTCYMMELDPKYCDVIRKRYAKFIGKEDLWESETQKVER